MRVNEVKWWGSETLPTVTVSVTNPEKYTKKKKNNKKAINLLFCKSVSV